MSRCAPHGRPDRPRTSTQLAMNTFFALDREPDEARELRPYSEPGDKPKRVAAPTPQPFRIQFLGTGSDSGLSILKEVEIRASDVSAAIIAAAMAPRPPTTVALRILDREGHEVFRRQKADHRLGWLRRRRERDDPKALRSGRAVAGHRPDRRASQNLKGPPAVRPNGPPTMGPCRCAPRRAVSPSPILDAVGRSGTHGTSRERCPGFSTSWACMFA